MNAHLVDNSSACACGYTVDAPMVQQEPVYGFWGWVLLILGATPTPKRVLYRCTRCGHVFGSTTDPAILRRIN